MLESALFLVGLTAGFINVIGGGGSFLTLPLLIFMGLPPSVANGTNRLGILMQTISAAVKFHKAGVLPISFSLIQAIPAVIGSLIGAYFAVTISDERFNKYLAVLMIIMTLFTVYNPSKYISSTENKNKTVITFIIFFFIGVYGGFIQAGVGFLLLAGALFAGLDTVKSNAVKTFITLIFTLFALPVFILNGKFDLKLGIILSAGNALGGIIGANVSMTKGEIFIKRFVTISIIIFSIKLLFF